MASLMFAELSDFFGRYLKDHKISNYEIIIAGVDIISEINKKDGSRNSYTSRYKNVDFCPSIVPGAICQEQFWGGSRKNYVDRYREQLGTKEAMYDLCSIVDLVVNKDLNVILLTSHREWAMEFFEYMREFIMENFKLYMVSCQEATIDPGLLTSYGDNDEIRAMLAFQINRYDLESSELNEFINKYTDDADNKLEEFLNSQTIDQLYEIGTKYSIHVNRFKPREEIIDRILSKIKKK